MAAAKAMKERTTLRTVFTTSYNKFSQALENKDSETIEKLFAELDDKFKKLMKKEDEVKPFVKDVEENQRKVKEYQDRMEDANNKKKIWDKTKETSIKPGKEETQPKKVAVLKPDRMPSHSVTHKKASDNHRPSLEMLQELNQEKSNHEKKINNTKKTSIKPGHEETQPKKDAVLKPDRMPSHPLTHKKASDNHRPSLEMLQELNQEKSNHEKRINNTNSRRLVEMTAQNDTLRAELARALEKSEMLESELKAMRRGINNNEKEESIQQLEAQNAKLRVELATLEKSKNAEVLELNKNLADLTTGLALREREIRDLMQQVDEKCMHEMGSTKDDLARVRKEREQLRARLAIEVSEKVSLLERLEVIGKENTMLQESCSAAVKAKEEANTRLKAQGKSTRQLEAKLREEWTTLENIKDSELVALNVNVAELTEQLELRESEIRDLMQCKEKEVDDKIIYEMDLIKDDLARVRIEREQLRVRLANEVKAKNLLGDRMKAAEKENTRLEDSCNAALKAKEEAEASLEATLSYFQSKLNQLGQLFD